MELPVFENQSPLGTLRVSRQGLYIRFETLLPPGEPGTLHRLWLAGGERAAPLGLLQPTGEGRRLCRRLSRLDCRALPPSPRRALVLPARAPAPPLSEERAEPLPPAAGPRWLRLSDGSLADPARGLLALPWDGGEPPPPARKISVAGRDYLVFHT